MEGPRYGKDCLCAVGNSLGQVSTVATATGGHRMPLTVHVGATGNTWSVQWAVPYVVRPLQMVVQSSATGELYRPPPGLDEVSQVEAISNEVMAQISGIMTAFQAQIK